MKILLVAATEMEIRPLLEKLATPGLSAPLQLGNVELRFLVTGVGMVATALSLGKHLSREIDFALNIGLAGSFHTGIELGEVVEVGEDRFSELGAEDGDAFIPASGLGLRIEDAFVNPVYSYNKVLSALPRVSGITVNTVHGNEQSIETVMNRFHPYVESMEGAAFLMACQSLKIPCAQVRAISNYVERRNKERWNIPLALSRLNIKTLEILNAFEK
jgi:futalosine hydrolase